ncbi:MAG: prolipoprotein diacylglyceryl transferase [Lachnospiraceae bacterium]|jgi:phosphatidylglycerol:prolipoprotein diacylglycerol transferase|nr:prolipoprotein diacylglyceryl transferase [Lachnospiraceae bacterium]
MLYNYSIAFPNLGITIEHLNKSFSIFGFPVAYYGLLIGIGIFAGIFMAVREAKVTGQNVEDYYDFALYAVIFSIIGARIYYVIFEWDSYKNDLLQIFNLRAGGMAIYGGIIAAVITLIVFAKKKKLSIGLMLDTGGLGLILGQIIGRWGNFVNREAFGGYTDGLLAMQLKMSEVYSAYITDDIAQHIQTINGVDYIQVHPTFLYESLWNIGVLIFLILFKKHKKFNGEVFCFYLILYGIGRSWIEGLRTDQLKVGDIAVSQVLSILLVLGVSIFVIWKHMKLRKEKWNELLKEKES